MSQYYVYNYCKHLHEVITPLGNATATVILQMTIIREYGSFQKQYGNYH